MVDPVEWMSMSAVMALRLVCLEPFCNLCERHNFAKHKKKHGNRVVDVIEFVR